MVIVGETLVSEDLLSAEFCCEVSRCMGACCVEGDAGAPLDAKEVEQIEQELDNIKPYMSAPGLKTLEETGSSTTDILGALVTSLNEGKECVFTVFDRGVAACAIEHAWMDGRSSFQKPLSCHLYPVRITKFPDYEAVNVHRWSVCSPGWTKGQKQGIKLYRVLKEALCRQYGESWYELLVEVAEAWEKRDQSPDLQNS